MEQSIELRINSLTISELDLVFTDIKLTGVEWYKCMKKGSLRGSPSKMIYENYRDSTMKHYKLTTEVELHRFLRNCLNRYIDFEELLSSSFIYIESNFWNPIIKEGGFMRCAIAYPIDFVRVCLRRYLVNKHLIDRQLMKNKTEFEVLLSKRFINFD